MELKSLTFLLFCLVVIAIYFLLQNTNKQKYVILVADAIYILTMSGRKSLLIIILITLVIYLTARHMESIPDKKQRFHWVIVAFIFSIGVLIYFKFFSNSFEYLKNLLNMPQLSMMQLASPIGLSYYSLALYAYTMDVYHKKLPAEKNFINMLIYVTYFPAILEGPINLYKKTMPQLVAAHKFDWNRMIMGCQRIIWGYFKKVVVADRIGIIVMAILGDSQAHGAMTFLAMVLYSFQIYTDFSGGIDVIMGVSEILDIRLTENFRNPLVSKNVTEYWQRWHESLGAFMEKYIYYPIVLNKKLLKFSRKIKHKYYSRAFGAIIASIIVFIIVGIWHGTGWNYVVYGMYQALFTATAVAFAPNYKKMKAKLHIDEKSTWWQVFCILRTFIILVFGRCLIKASNLPQAGELYSKIFHFDNIGTWFDGTILNYGLDVPNLIVMFIGILIVILADVIHERGVNFREALMAKPIAFRYLVYYIGIFAIIIFGIYGPEFSAASFIYQGF